MTELTKTKEELIEKNRKKRDRAIEESKQDMLRHTAPGPIINRGNNIFPDFNIENIDREDFREHYY